MMSGKNITMSGDPLQKTDWSTLISEIRKPDQDTISLIQQLRTIQTIDVQSYRRMKTRLPYFVAGIFNPPYRKSENFAHISSFILDIDHIRQKELDIAVLREKLINDERIFVLFESPGGDGLKLIFRLKEKLYDRGQFSVFYKTFCTQFALQYALEQVLDARTSDVTRACFYSYDPMIYHNEAASEIEVAAFVDFNNEMMVKDLEDLFKNAPAPEPEAKPTLQGSVLSQIRQTLNPSTRKKEAKPVYVPEEIELVLDTIRQELAKHQVGVEDVQSIHYGKKIRVKVENFWAEINVFYGKKGFSVVKTPKNGSNSDLADIAWQIVDALFNGFENESIR